MRAARLAALCFYLRHYRKLQDYWPAIGSTWMYEDAQLFEKKIRWICKKSGLNADYFLHKEW